LMPSEVENARRSLKISNCHDIGAMHLDN